MGSKNSPKGFGLSADALGTETVTIYVGPKRKKFLVHKKLICDRSDYFSKAFKGGFQETEKGVIYLPEDDSQAFDSFIVFIYRDTLPKFVADEDLSSEKEINHYTNKKLCPLFYLAEKYCMNELANKVIDAIQDFDLEHGKVPSAAGIQEIYEETGHKSKLRLYGTLCALHQTMVDTVDTVTVTDEDWRSDSTDYTELAPIVPEFAADFIMLLRKHRDSLVYEYPADPQIRNGRDGFGKCYFHTHGKGEKCHLAEDE